MITPQALGVELGKAVIWLTIGFVIGWITRGLKEKYITNMDNEKVIALIVTLVWTISVLASVVNPSYQTPIAIHSLVGLVVGFYFKNKLGL